MAINELISLLRKKGFRDTIKVLTQFKNFETDKHTFYDELNKFSYYNSFFRVKDDLIDKGLIKIEKNNKNKKVIKLTKKGVDIYNRLVEIDNLLNHHKKK
ncbi:MAG: hypothetical protein EU539_05310 [Promethearchaeota archaeon]|nr:MAG: hypothetical protein EU539_05310 [Candidatus Lokiarchaeota archaeon]